MSYWRDEEENTLGALWKYTKIDIDANLRFEFAEGDVYIASYFTSYDSDNEVEIDAGVETEEDDFFEMDYRIEKAIKGGRQLKSCPDYLLITYRNFPVKVTNEATGELIYPAQEETVETE
ncbi:MAG: hypothetical protein LBL67_02760 [Coriobacteriales bacterium]|jgi:hypothetical protein|nr:hypothetical protein [Coriobacteriales bacterium]